MDVGRTNDVGSRFKKGIQGDSLKQGEVVNIFLLEGPFLLMAKWEWASMEGGKFRSLNTGQEEGL